MEWKPIVGYEGYYEISDSGSVRSVDRVICDKNGKKKYLIGKEMCLTRSKGRNNDGYYVVNLRKNGTSKVVPVHVLVAFESSYKFGWWICMGKAIRRCNDYPVREYARG